MVMTNRNELRKAPRTPSQMATTRCRNTDADHLTRSDNVDMPSLQEGSRSRTLLRL